MSFPQEKDDTLGNRSVLHDNDNKPNQFLNITDVKQIQTNTNYITPNEQKIHSIKPSLSLKKQKRGLPGSNNTMKKDPINNEKADLPNLSEGKDLNSSKYKDFISWAKSKALPNSSIDLAIYFETTRNLLGRAVDTDFGLKVKASNGNLDSLLDQIQDYRNRFYAQLTTGCEQTTCTRKFCARNPKNKLLALNHKQKLTICEYLAVRALETPENLEFQPHNAKTLGSLSDVQASTHNAPTTKKTSIFENSIIFKADFSNSNSQSIFESIWDKIRNSWQPETKQLKCLDNVAKTNFAKNPEKKYTPPINSGSRQTSNGSYNQQKTDIESIKASLPGFNLSMLDENNEPLVTLTRIDKASMSCLKDIIEMSDHKLLLNTIRTLLSKSEVLHYSFYDHPSTSTNNNEINTKASNIDYNTAAEFAELCSLHLLIVEKAVNIGRTVQHKKFLIRFIPKQTS
ncbi:hypothetical protein BB559_005635 [Furculomyces boomerangus]|uniref:Ubiquitin-protein ligase E3A N-terminal zinc-binding domain-containing protein n=1 Tax=Furculomyces boomerangus TaxID=61424 RepID=A0A2T9Y7H0_9FUNG|nr:hypothetical protein BB559_005635 [Furculomyces boomerangus]